MLQDESELNWTYNKVDGSRIAEIFSMADRLAAGEARAETGGVAEKKDEIRSKWQQLEGSIQTYRQDFSFDQSQGFIPR